MFHGILVDGVVERVMGRPDRADAEVRKLRKSGHLSEYLFAAISEAEFDQKKQKITTVVMARTEKQ